MVLAVLGAHSTPSWAGEAISERLAGQLVRAALAVIESDPLTVEAVNGALLLGQQAVALDPENPELWRAMLRLADLADRDDLRSTAIQRLVRLDPRDDVVRLLYVNNALERYQTAERRARAYERLLAPENQKQLGPAVSSRLANDLALLLRRLGDVEGFGRWLAEAVALDPSNRAAAATAAGFFGQNVQDPFAEAELLATLALADPADVDTQVALAQLLLDHGAYVGADRLYQLAARTRDAASDPPASGLLADAAVARWARGQADEALGIIGDRQQEADAAYRLRVRQENPQMSALEVARLHAPVSATLATVRAAIHNRLGDARAGPALRSALATYELGLQALEAQENRDSAEIANRNLEAAWVAVWLGEDIEQVRGFLDAAKRALPDGELDEPGRQRFEGWIALRQGDLEQAVLLLQPLADADLAARLGLALAQLEQGHRQEAARGLLAVARSQPGTLMGVWAADVLAELLHQRLSLTEQAARMDQLIASIPTVVDRFPDEPTLAVSVRVIPRRTTYAAFEQFVIDLEITNHAPFPLAIDADGPIRPHIAVIPKIHVSRTARMGALRAIIVDIDRRLRLEPHERLIVPVDLRQGVLNEVLNAVPLRGATVEISAVMNFVLSPAKVVRPGILGSKVSTRAIRVDGMRVSRQWLSATVAALLDPNTPPDVVAMAAVSHVVGGLAAAKEVPDEIAQLLPAAPAALAEAYPRLDAVAQAWLLAVMSRGEDLEPLLAMARKSEDKVVRISYLLFRVTGLDDPMLDAAKRGSDPDVHAIADLMEFGLHRQTTQPDQ